MYSSNLNSEFKRRGFTTSKLSPRLTPNRIWNSFPHSTNNLHPQQVPDDTFGLSSVFQKNKKPLSRPFEACASCMLRSLIAFSATSPLASAAFESSPWSHPIQRRGFCDWAPFQSMRIECFEGSTDLFVIMNPY